MWTVVLSLLLQDELRYLRKKTKLLANQMDRLRDKWRAGLPDQRMRYEACVAARAKWLSSQSEKLNRELRKQLTQQQLYFASLQHNFTQSPLLEPSRSKDIFQKLHRSLSLSGHQSPQHRIAQLRLQCQLMLKSTQTVIKRFMSRHVAKATLEMPFGDTSVMADTTSTYVSNILLCWIPNLPLETAFNLVLQYSSNRDLTNERLGIRIDSHLIYNVGYRQQYLQLNYRNGRHVSSTMRLLFAAQLSEDEAVISCDFVEQDDLMADPDERDLQRQFCYGRVADRVGIGVTVNDATMATASICDVWWTPGADSTATHGRCALQLAAQLCEIAERHPIRSALGQWRSSARAAPFSCTAL